MLNYNYTMFSNFEKGQKDLTFRLYTITIKTQQHRLEEVKHYRKKR